MIEQIRSIRVENNHGILKVVDEYNTPTIFSSLQQLVEARKDIFIKPAPIGIGIEIIAHLLIGILSER